jgi:hypothetical protein
MIGGLQKACQLGALGHRFVPLTQHQSQLQTGKQLNGV